MFKSLGNLLVNPNVGLLFIAMHGKPKRLRVNGTAMVRRDDPLLASTVGAQLMVRVTAPHLSQLPALHSVDGADRASIYAPRPGCLPVEPAWKGFDDFKGYVHPRQPTARGDVDKGE